jgi:hypothetical protein
VGKRKTKQDQANELEERRQKLEAYKAEAKSFGVYITGDRLNQAARIVNKLRKDREGKPPCYWRNYDRTAKECRICEVRHDCARGEEVPAEIPVDELKPVACRKCAAGHFEVELADKDSGEVLDYACNNRECTATLSEQVRWVEGEEEKAKKQAKKRKPKVKVEPRRKDVATNVELEHAILEHVDANPGANTREIVSAIKGGATRKMKVLKGLVEQGKITREKAGKGFRFWPPTAK